MTYEQKLDKLAEASAKKFHQHNRALDSLTNKRNVGKPAAFEKFDRTFAEWKAAHKEYETFWKEMRERKIDPKSKYKPK